MTIAATTHLFYVCELEEFGAVVSTLICLVGTFQQVVLINESVRFFPNTRRSRLCPVTSLPLLLLLLCLISLPLLPPSSSREQRRAFLVSVILSQLLLLEEEQLLPQEFLMLVSQSCL